MPHSKSPTSTKPKADKTPYFDDLDDETGNTTPRALKRHASSTATVKSAENDRHPAATPNRRGSPVVVACDKIVLTVPVSKHDLDAVVQRALTLQREGTLIRSTSKGNFFEHNFKLRFDGGGLAFFRIGPKKPKMKTLMQLVFNPNPSHMVTADADALKSVWKTLFLTNAAQIARDSKFQRIDLCADSHNRLDDLIVDLDRSRVGSKVFTRTALGAKLETIYLGGIESAHHGIAYDQQAADKHKRRVGEVDRRVPMRDDAEIVLEKKATTLRVESRRLFRTPVSFGEIADLRDVFADYRIYDISRTSGSRLSSDFLCYLDCVRLRGINGARRWLTDNAHDKRATAKNLAEHEVKLQRMAVDWWQPDEFNHAVREILKSSPAWPFMLIMDTPK